jgi:uncharacterized protein (DUF305 family)
MSPRTLIVGTLLTLGVLSGCSQQPTAMDMQHESGEHMDMTMDGMVESLEGKTGDDFDQAFIAAMIPHHQGAVDMAKLALEHAKHPELKKLATEIIDAQNKEIALMQGWQNGNWAAEVEAMSSSQAAN